MRTGAKRGPNGRGFQEKNTYYRFFPALEFRLPCGIRRRFRALQSFRTVHGQERRESGSDSANHKGRRPDTLPRSGVFPSAFEQAERAGASGQKGGEAGP